MLLQYLSQLRALHLVQARQHGFDAAELGHEFFGGLLPYAWHPGDVVRAVTHKPQYIDDALWPDTKTLPYLGYANTLVFHGVQDGRVFCHQLAQVLVTAYQHDIVALSLEASGQGAQDVV